MLKSKKALYVLLPLTLVIWGLIAYKIYTGLKGDDEEIAENNVVVPAVLLNKGIDTFSLFNNYRDPFLSDIKRTVIHVNSGNNSKPVNPVKNTNTAKSGNLAVTNDWPAVQYAGILKNQSNSTALILLSVNGKTYTLKQGDVAEGMKVLSFSNSEVTLQRGKEKKVFSK